MKVQYRYNNPLFVALVCFGLALAIAALSLQAEFSKTRLQFEQAHDSFADSLAIKMTTCTELVRYVAGVFAADPFVNPLTFREYLEKTNDLLYPAGLRVVGFAQKVSTSDGPKLEHQIQKLGLRDFKIFPKTNAKLEFPIVAIDPYNSKTRSMIGFDIKTAFDRSDTLDLANMSGKAAITGKILLGTPNHHQRRHGIALYYPVYKKGQSIGTSEDRETSLLGYAFGSIWPDEFIESILEHDRNGLRDATVEVYDGVTLNPNNLLFQALGKETKSLFPADMTWSKESRIQIVDRTWTVISKRPFAMPPFKRFQFALGVLAFGSILSVIIFIVLQGREKKTALISLLLEDAKRELEVRKRMQDELSVSYERFRLVSKAAKDIIWDLDLATRKVTWNEALELLFGHDTDQASTSLEWYFDKIHPSDREQIMAQRQQVIASDQDNWNLTYRLKANDNTYHRVFERGFIVRNAEHQAIRILGIIQDLNPIDKTQDALRQSEERLHLAMEASDLGIWEMHDSNKSFHCSTRLQQMLGLMNDDFTLTNLIRFIPRNERKEIVSKLREKMESAVQRFTLQIPIQHEGTQNQLRWIEIHGKAINPNAEKGTLQYAGVALDVTAQKNSALEIIEAKEAAESANTAKSLFLANISHEIRTPLAAIQGFSKLLYDPDISETDREHFFGMVEKNGNQLMALIDDLLDFTKIETNKMVLEKVPFSLRQLMDDVVNSLSIKAAEKALQINVSFGANIPDVIISDPTRLRQVLFNVIGNGIKFTDRGSVSVKVEKVIQKGRQTCDIRFIINDSGIGMTDGQQQGLFQAFTQADASTTRRFGGTGLGLVISKRLAQAMSGDLRLLSSIPKEGSTFELTIDSGVTSSAWNTEVPSKIAPARTNLMHKLKEYIGTMENKSILVADDALENRILLERILSKTGAHIASVENGAEALERFDQKNFDAVILDIQMPICDGYQTASRLRQGGFKGPIVALTAHAMREERNRCLEAGFDEHISKPVDFVKLIEILRNMMS